MKNLKVLLYSSLIMLAACTNEAEDKPVDRLDAGDIEISVDETFRPVIEEQLQVFDSSYPNANITPHYVSETQAINDFMQGNARLILITRTFSDEEIKSLEEQKIVHTSLAIAKDAVAVVVNNNASDSVFNIEQLKGILTGQYKKPYTVVFDHQGSSTVRYMQDSLLKGQKLGSNVFAASSNDSVIQYVANNPDAIGFVGVSFVSDMNDPEGLAFIDEVKVAQIFNDSLNEAYKPYQAYIANDSYPLTRNLYYIHRETWPGLGTGFANFLSKERGQLIFKQARLFPLRTSIIFREAQINQ